MTPGGVITGRITGRTGMPLTGARVRVMKPWISENQRQLRVVQEVVANDLGDYRLIWLMPGRYYLSATYVDYNANNPASAQLIIDPDATGGANASRSVSRPVISGQLPNGLAADEVYTPIYYPTTLDSDKAVAIDLKRGEEYGGADINVSPVRAFHVRGVVANLPPPPAQPAGRQGAGPNNLPPGINLPPGVTLPPGVNLNNLPPQLAQLAAGGQPLPIRLAPLSPNGSFYATQANGTTGEFDFPKVIAGNYVAYLFQNGATIRKNIEVSTGDVNGVALPISEGVDIPINLTFEGQKPPNLPDYTRLTPTLWRNPTILNAPSMPATEGTPLALKNITPGSYHVYVNPLLPASTGNAPPPLTQIMQWAGAYVKSIKLGPIDVLVEGLNFERQPEASLDIVIAANPGRLEGRVLDENKQPVVGAFVTLFAQKPENRIYRTDMYKVVGTDTQGRFSVLGLAPGDYKVFGWEFVERNTWMDPAFLKVFEDRGVSIRIEEGKTATLDVPNNRQQ
jgi:hypothetical protein